MGEISNQTTDLDKSIEGFNESTQRLLENGRAQIAPKSYDQDAKIENIDANGAQKGGAPIPPINHILALPKQEGGQQKPGQMITTSDSDASLQPDAVRHEVVQEFGSFATGLEAIQTMLAPFAVVVAYRHYHLMDTTAEPKDTELRYMYKVKKQIDGLYQTMGVFSGLEIIELL